MSTAVMSSSMFDCGELYKISGTSKTKENGSMLNQSIGQPGHTNVGISSISSISGVSSVPSIHGNGHTPLRRSYSSLVSLIEQHRKLDRSVSEPTSRYKTELCRPFEESGSCKYGDKCQFAHGLNELRNLARHPKYKTELCRTFHKIGFCPYGPRCHFVHNFEEARIHNLKVSAQLGQNITLGPFLQPAAAALNMNISLLEQLAVSPQVAAAVHAAAAVSAPQNSLTRTSSLGLNRSAPVPLFQQHRHQPLHRSNSLNQPLQTQQSNRPKPLNLSPTFSLGSTADSISPSSSLSQSPTNSMASFFNDEPAASTTIANATFGFGQDFSLVNTTRQSPSPQSVLDELSPRTPSPLSPNAESRLPVFNRISNTIADLDNLKI